MFLFFFSSIRPLAEFRVRWCALSGPRAANRRWNGRPQRWMTPSRRSKRAIGGGMTRQQQGRSHCHSGACTCDGLFSRSSHVASATLEFWAIHDALLYMLNSLNSLQSLLYAPTHSAANPASNLYPTRASHSSQTCVVLLFFFAGHGYPGPARAAVNLDHKQRRCPIDRAAHLLAFVTANSITTWPAPPAYSFCRSPTGGEKSCDGKRPKLLRLPWQRRLASGRSHTEHQCHTSITAIRVESRT